MWSYNRGFDLAFPTGIPGQTKVGSFSTVDLSFRYDFTGEGALADTALMLNVSNLFDKYPPVYFGGDIVRNQRGFRNGNTLGRLVQVGFSKQF